MTLGAGDRWAAFGSRGFRSYWLALVLNGFAVQIQTVAVGWYIYDLTGNPLDLGLVGLSQFLPALLLVMITGTVADRFPRRNIMAICLLVEASTALLLLWVILSGNQSAAPIFLIMALFGLARAFYNPARQSIVVSLVPKKQLASAIAANSTTNQFATICGPVAGGVLYAIGAQYALGATATFMVIASIVVVVGIPAIAVAKAGVALGLSAIGAGFRFIFTNKPVLGAVSLDLFAVLLGGATALLPVYARDILLTGPEGLGILRAGPAIGAIAVGLFFMARPIQRHAGVIMFIAVIGFGLATFLFAISTTLWFSVAMLVLVGAFDMVSVNIRSVLLQLWTPDDVRGRVNAVNQVFIGASNELGAFRSGVMAVWLGPVAAVAVGGAMILGIGTAWAVIFPQLRQVSSLQQSIEQTKQ